MPNKYVLDACSIIAFLNDEDGADVVQLLLEEAGASISKLYIHKLNFLEVYYGILRDEGMEKAELADTTIRALPIEILTDISDDIFYEAGRIKASYRLSLADAVALATSIKNGSSLVTSDHHEFDVLVEPENLSIKWIR
jgi:predicted nucleic acid-binding protein